ncbi:MAG: N-acetylmuramoyl-L-alanine amidase [Limnochordaceae bacterium]|nr:N-acetylmuramoyl-L-alanine amidase [Limnochordaceae bacterium]
MSTSHVYRARRLRVVLDGRVLEGTVGRLDGQAAWVNAAAIASRWGARLDVGEDVLGWHDPRTGRTVVFRRGRAQAHLDGDGAVVALAASPDWSDGMLIFPADAVALAGGASVSVDTRAGVVFLTRPDPYLSSWRILLDPGHGGRDPGSSLGGGLVEKDLNLSVARRLGRLLKAAGAVVGLTRVSDVDLTAGDRCARARRFRAAMAVSIHHGLLPEASLQGAEAYFYRREDSRRLAASLAGALARGLHLPSRGVREANVGFLSCLSCPAAVTEAALPGDDDILRKLNHPWGRIQEALALLEGIRGFCSTAQADGVVWGYPSP